MTYKNYSILRGLLNNDLRFDFKFLYDLNQVAHFGPDVVIPVKMGMYLFVRASREVIDDCLIPSPDYSILDSSGQLVHFWSFIDEDDEG